MSELDYARECGTEPEPAENERVRAIRALLEELDSFSPNLLNRNDVKGLTARLAKNEVWSRIATPENVRSLLSLLPARPGIHKLLTPETCPCDKTSDVSCNVCDGGLAICSACGKAEAELSEPCAVQPEPCPPHSPCGQAWREWFDRVGEHATIDVVNATANLVITEREIHAAASREAQDERKHDE